MLQNKEKQNIPKEWIYKSIGEFCEVINGSTPKSQVAKYWNGEIVWATPNDVRDSNIFISDSERKITREGLKSIGDRSVPENSIVISTRAPIGYVGVTKQQTAFNQGCKGIMSNSSHPVFLYYSMLNDGQKLKKMGAGSTFPELSAGDLKKHSLLLPPLKEQQKIVEVLGAVDEEIEKTKEVIKATEKLKKGLMQKLFSHGIGHTKFKQTEIGEIPESWSVTTVRNSSLQLIDGDRGTNYPKRNDFLDEGYCLFLSAKNVTKGGFVFDELNFITKKKDEALRKGKLERGDIILTSRGTVGNVAIYDESVRCEHIRINSGMLIFRNGKDFIPEFLYWYLTSPQMQSAFKKMGSGSAQPQLPVGSLELIPVLVIPEEEQEKISEMISSVHKKISVNKKLLVKQTELKKGLMQDLLSGVKRVRA